MTLSDAKGAIEMSNGYGRALRVKRDRVIVVAGLVATVIVGLSRVAWAASVTVQSDGTLSA